MQLVYRYSAAPLPTNTRAAAARIFDLPDVAAEAGLCKLNSVVDP